MKKYRVTLRTHYGMDLHDYWHEEVDEAGLKKLKEEYPFDKICIGHTYDNPKDDISHIRIIK